MSARSRTMVDSSTAACGWRRGGDRVPDRFGVRAGRGVDLSSRQAGERMQLEGVGRKDLIVSFLGRGLDAPHVKPEAALE